MSDIGQFRIERLDPAKHRREAFRCESAGLTEFIQKRARKEMEARASACFVLVPVEDAGRIDRRHQQSVCALSTPNERRQRRRGA